MTRNSRTVIYLFFTNREERIIKTYAHNMVLTARKLTNKQLLIKNQRPDIMKFESPKSRESEFDWK